MSGSEGQATVTVAGLEAAMDEQAGSAAGLYVPKSLIVAKGDLLAGTGAGVLARLPVGSDGTVLTADAAQTAGVKWAALTFGSAADYQTAGTPAAGSTGRYADAGHVHPGPHWIPEDNNLIAATYDPANAGTVTSQSSAGVAGRVTLTRVMLRRAITWSSIWFGLAGVDAGAALSNCYLGVYDSTGARVAVTADISSSLSSGATAKKVDFTSPYAAPAGEYFIAMLLNGTWTTNSFTFKASGAGISVNANLSASHLRYSSMLTGQTSLPTSLTLASQTTNTISGGWGSQWYGIS